MKEYQRTGKGAQRRRRRSRKRSVAGVVICVILMVVQVIAGVILCLEIAGLALLPVRYLAIIALVLVLMTVIEILLVVQRSRISSTLSGIFAVCLSVCIVVGCVYAQKTSDTLASISRSATEPEFDEVSVAVLMDSGISTLEELKGSFMGIQTDLDRDNSDQTVENLQVLLDNNLTVHEYDGIYDMVQALYDGDIQSVIFNESYRSMIEDSFATFDDDIRVLNTYTYTSMSENTEEVEKYIRNDEEMVTDPFIIYFSGIDTYGDIATKSRSDVNILAVVNPTTKQILLVTTPRDYYVELPFADYALDKLTHAGIYGIDKSIETLEYLYDIDIDYYLRVNFTGFMDIVDALGGVNVYSERSFTGEVGNYDYTEGYNEVNGSMALGFVRERHSFADGDEQRARNQMAMIQAIIAKATSPSILVTYTDVLDSIADSINTDMSTEEIAALVRMQLSDNASWNIETYSTQGTGARRSTYSMGSQLLYVALPDADSIQEAKELMQEVKDGRILGEEDAEETETSDEDEDSDVAAEDIDEEDEDE